MSTPPIYPLEPVDPAVQQLLFFWFGDPADLHSHRQVIAQFGRFPHRNEVLGRDTTVAEAAFLQQPGSRF